MSAAGATWVEPANRVEAQQRADQLFVDIMNLQTEARALGVKRGLSPDAMREASATLGRKIAAKQEERKRLQNWMQGFGPSKGSEQSGNGNGNGNGNGHGHAVLLRTIPPVSSGYVASDAKDLLERADAAMTRWAHNGAPLTEADVRLLHDIRLFLGKRNGVASLILQDRAASRR